MPRAAQNESRIAASFFSACSGILTAMAVGDFLANTIYMYTMFFFGSEIINPGAVRFCLRPTEGEVPDSLRQIELCV